LHNLAQAAHCAAQGKVGSGFDVAAAVYGTCIYTRFSPSILASLESPGSAGFSTQLRGIVESGGVGWDTEVKKDDVKIPAGMALVMCDVDCGSQTVGMVKQVLAWRDIEPESSKKLWDELQACNATLAANLSTSNASEQEITKAFEAIRSRIRDMGTRSGVLIEPQEQTELLDALTKVDGVVGGVVPGAGGYDAVALLVRDDKKTMGALEAFLKTWSAEKKGNVKLLGAKGELEGARNEDVSLYEGFSK
jgi:phosphomevalonate kinase